MKYTPNPLLYAANQDFFSSFKLVIIMKDPVDHGALSRAVANAAVRYPYFSIRPVKCGNEILLEENPLPIPVFPHENCEVLGSKACNGHLIAFGCKERRIYLNASHFIADGMGISPFMMTVLALYVAELYGSEGVKTERIPMPNDPVMAEEYSYPFSLPTQENTPSWAQKQSPEKVYPLSPERFDKEGLYAYHLRISQQEMMAKANPSDGSPVSFLTVMLYRALCELDENLSLPVIAHVQHQYRDALMAPNNRHSLVSYIPAEIPTRAKAWSLERQNTLIRGQMILASETEAELCAIERLVSALPCGEKASLDDKKAAMRQYVEQSIENKTFGISYVGKMNWCGLDQYVEDLHVYIGEKNTPNMLLIEVMTIGADFSINLMQSGRGDDYVRAFVHQLEALGLTVTRTGEERYTLCDTQLPEA